MVITRSQSRELARQTRDHGDARIATSSVTTKTATLRKQFEVANRISNFLIKPKISKDRPKHLQQPPGLNFQLQPAEFGLIQERICSSLYALVVQAVLWNQTRGLQARPVLFKLLEQYPTPAELSRAELGQLTLMLQPLGLHNIRAARLKALARAWEQSPPCRERRYRKLHYPDRGDGLDVGPQECLAIDDERRGWEIAHLPGVGAYALDSFRIFYRDRLRRIESNSYVEAEWKRVNATDKDLRIYLQWKWAMLHPNAKLVND